MNFQNSKTVIMGALILAVGLFWQLKSTRPIKKPPSAEETLPAAREPAAQGKESLNETANVSKTIHGKDELVKLIYETKECYASESCDFPHSDPKSYEIATGKKLKDLLKAYRSKFAKDVKNKSETESLAREFMAVDDQFVQEVSLEMLSDVAPSSENLKVLTESLQGTLDPLLVEQAMNEMKRYIGTSEEPQVHRFLQDLLGQGAVFSSEKAVQGIFPFINPQSYPSYDKVARSLPADSSVGKDLRALLEEYRRMRTGG